MHRTGSIPRYPSPIYPPGLCLFVCLCLSLSVYACLWVSVCVCLIIVVWVFLCRCVCVSLSLSVCMFSVYTAHYFYKNQLISSEIRQMSACVCVGVFYLLYGNVCSCVGVHVCVCGCIHLFFHKKLECLQGLKSLLDFSHSSAKKLLISFLLLVKIRKF